MGSSRNTYQTPFSKRAKITGICLTILVHGLLMFISVRAEITALTPPQKNEILIEFLEEEPKPIDMEVGIEPKSIQAEPENEVRLVQKSEAPLESMQANVGDESEVGDNGDVEIPEPPKPKPINKRALFRSARNIKDSIAAQAAEKKSEEIKAGHSLGNTLTGSTDGSPTAQLEGRTTKGSLPLPEYNVEDEGTVVVEINVDPYGNVTNARAGVSGTTVQNDVLWKAAKEAALKAKFNSSSSAPIAQQGTITYKFKLK